MKRKQKKPVNKGGGYPGPRDPVTGMTPRQIVDTRRGQLLAIQIAKERAALVLKSEVDAGMRECSSVIGSDLFGALPSRLATVLGGGKHTAEQVRQVALEIISEMVRNWIQAEIIPKESKPDENS